MLPNGSDFPNGSDLANDSTNSNGFDFPNGSLCCGAVAAERGITVGFEVEERLASTGGGASNPLVLPVKIVLTVPGFAGFALRPD